MELRSIKEDIVTNVYHIDKHKNITLHKHPKHDEIFYCIKGEGFGVLEDKEIKLTVGKEFIVHADVIHSLRSDSELYVVSFLIPII
ncbi:TPA: cupin domain-containing protein [Clostridioides difficile]|nr:cupin domain-containing protein [Clostridioides difficile]HDJ1470932.1 cupin domain-containing protein [Clostridioides difficile]